MPKDISHIIDKFISEVKKILGKRINKIILYGSYARGDYNKDSDVDIMILTDLTDAEIVEYREKIWELSADIELDTGIIISPLLKNTEKFESWIEVLPFYMNVMKDGVVLIGKENKQ